MIYCDRRSIDTFTASAAVDWCWLVITARPEVIPNNTHCLIPVGTFWCSKGENFHVPVLFDITSRAEVASRSKTKRSNEISV